MDKTPGIGIYRCTTLEIPARDRFDAWAAGGSCQYSIVDSAGVPFDWESSGATVGPLSIGWHTWLHPSRRAVIKADRSSRQIAARGLDLYQFTIHLDAGFVWLSGPEPSFKQRNELYVIDATQPFESEITTGNVVWMAIPRSLLPVTAEWLHGKSLKQGVGQLLADHLRSLVANLPRLNADDIGPVVQAALHLASACAARSPDLFEQANAAIESALQQRVKNYIDANLSSLELTPDLICKQVGLSRSKLYQLFEPHGGVMRQIQRKRLESAYRMLADPAYVRESIATIAWRHGFRDEKYFSRIFKAEFGHTPSETLERAGQRLHR
ncbi:helix-turn-helix domain-containing protein [Burkholderia sp. MSMB617WGS]|uniref:helix-turn-helix domain-containing protein n=1 Tax=Burkholderia sp. MSMB617WGS TaxID=1637831 RepID=UPI00075FBD62|nr:helix-turn-helix domain-containing protein [Burkholderia sp. MSMB617WGS]